MPSLSSPAHRLWSLLPTPSTGYSTPTVFALAEYEAFMADAVLWEAYAVTEKRVTLVTASGDRHALSHTPLDEMIDALPEAERQGAVVSIEKGDVFYTDNSRRLSYSYPQLAICWRARHQLALVEEERRNLEQNLPSAPPARTGTRL